MYKQLYIIITEKATSLRIMLTSREANKEATPMGMKTMLTSINAEITCTNKGRLKYFYR